MAGNGPSGLPYLLPLTNANDAPNPDYEPPLAPDLNQPLPARPAWPAVVNINPAIDGRLNALKGSIENRKENEYRFKQEIYRLILNILYDAKQRGNNVITLTQAQSGYLDNLLTQLAVAASDTTEINRASVDATLSQLRGQRPNLRTGGWTPKPRRKPTKRHQKKRKSVKSHA